MSEVIVWNRVVLKLSCVVQYFEKKRNKKKSELLSVAIALKYSNIHNSDIIVLPKFRSAGF